MQLHDIKESVFYSDGSLRDICVLDSNIENWQSVINALSDSKFECELIISGERASLPFNVAEIFANKDEHTAGMAVKIGKATANCHFFGTSEIEFDIVPGDVKHQNDFNQLLKLMRILAKATSKNVILTPENMHERALITCSAETGGYTLNPAVT